MTSLTTTPPLPPDDVSSVDEAIARELAQDRPTVDAAVKSFASLVAARSITKKASRFPSQEEGPSSQPRPCYTESSQEALLYARRLLQAINSYTFPTTAILPTSSVTTDASTATNTTKSVYQSVVAQVWNGLVQSDQKPTRFLGRLALSYAWKGIMNGKSQQSVNDNVPEQETLFFLEFGNLLESYTPHDYSHAATTSTTSTTDVDNDACLLWDPDGGKEELQRRRDRRTQRATDAQQLVSQQDTSASTLEE